VASFTPQVLTVPADNSAVYIGPPTTYGITSVARPTTYGDAPATYRWRFTGWEWSAGGKSGTIYSGGGVNGSNTDVDKNYASGYIRVPPGTQSATIYATYESTASTSVDIMASTIVARPGETVKIKTVGDTKLASDYTSSGGASYSFTIAKSSSAPNAQRSNFKYNRNTSSDGGDGSSTTTGYTSSASSSPWNATWSANWATGAYKSFLMKGENQPFVYDLVIPSTAKTGDYYTLTTLYKRPASSSGVSESVTVHVLEEPKPPVESLSVTKTASDATPHQGDTVTYKVTVENDGEVDLENISFSDVIGGGLSIYALTYKSAESTSGVQVSLIDATHATITRLAVKQKAVLEYKVDIPSNAQTGVYSNTASFESDSGVEEQATATITVQDAYQVTYDANGGSNSPTDATLYKSGDTATLKSGAAMTPPANQVFKEWNTLPGGGGTSYQPGATHSMTGDITFYALWEETGGNNGDNGGGDNGDGGGDGGDSGDNGDNGGGDDEGNGDGGDDNGTGGDSGDGDSEDSGDGTDGSGNDGDNGDSSGGNNNGGGSDGDSGNNNGGSGGDNGGNNNNGSGDNNNNGNNNGGDNASVADGTDGDGSTGEGTADSADPAASDSKTNEPAKYETVADKDASDAEGPAQKSPSAPSASPLTGLSAEDLARTHNQTGNPIFDIAAGNVPMGGFGVGGAWSLLSLLLSLIALIGVLVSIVASLFRGTPKSRLRALKNCEGDEDRSDAGKQGYAELFVQDHTEDRPQRRRRLLLLFVAMSIAGILVGVIWLLLDNLAQPMVWVNRWTIIVGIVFVIYVALTITCAAVQRRSSASERYTGAYATHRA
jgi:uncharacterized repeat protein (TIGR01451 family)